MQPGHQRIQMRGTRHDQPLDRQLHVLIGDRFGVRHPRGLIGQRVHQPRLALTRLECPLHGFFGELLTGLRGVLSVQVGHFTEREVVNAKGGRFDVERA
jgi:hypothetical protein